MNTHPVKNESAPPSFIDFPDGRRLAYHLSEGKLPGVVFMGGFKSDMAGVKATALETFCRKEGRRFLRFDYSGHGRSSGDFRQNTIGSWKQDALDMIDQVAMGRNILVGSSMGAWIVLLVARERPQGIAGLIGIASAADFTERLIWQKLDDAQKKQLEEEGVIYLPSCAGQEPYPITSRLIKDGRQHLLLDKKIAIHAPVRLIHGDKDEDVPWQMSVALMDCIVSPDISLELVKDGDHRLSQPEHLEILCRTIACHPALDPVIRQGDRKNPLPATKFDGNAVTPCNLHSNPKIPASPPDHAPSIPAGRFTH